MSIKSLLFVGVCLLILLISCKNETKLELPFEEEKIIQILADMHFAKSAAKIYKGELRDSMKLVYESQVYTINGIDEKDYDEIIRYLESNLTIYYDIEKKVHQYLKTIQSDKS